MNGNFECRFCMNVSNEKCNVFNGCLSELERVNNYYLVDDVNSEEGSDPAVAQRIGLGWKAYNSMSMLCGKRHMEY